MKVNAKGYRIEHGRSRFEVSFGDIKSLGGSLCLGYGFKSTKSIPDLNGKPLHRAKSLELMIEIILDYSDDIRTEVEDLLRIVKRYHTVRGFTDCGRPTKKGTRFLDRLNVGSRITKLRIRIKELLNQ